MPRIKRERMRPTVGERFVRAVATLIAQLGDGEADGNSDVGRSSDSNCTALPFIHRIEVLTERDWSSATFVGVRLHVMLTHAPTTNAATVRLSAEVSAADYRLGRHIVADLTAHPRAGGLLLDALILEAH